MSAHKPDALTMENQRKASDPSRSAWVSANAGSGKTHVLTQRVVRLLLGGVAPSRILCLTFTKAAAANMSERVSHTLAEWTLLDDETLGKAIAHTGAPAPSDPAFVRRLFARAVETPGGLKIQTIHAFCERILHLFPFEANVPADFRVVEDMEQAELLLEARHFVLRQAGDPGAPLHAPLAALAAESGAETFNGLIDALLKHRNRLSRHSLDEHCAMLAQALELAPGETSDSIRDAMIHDGIAPSEWNGIAVVYAGGLKTDQNRAAMLIQAAQLAPAHECLPLYLKLFFGKDGPLANVASKHIKTSAPDVALRLEAEQLRLIGLQEKQNATETFSRTRNLLSVGIAILDHYAHLKSMRGLLDFDDLIGRTHALLSYGQRANWVLYKLDGGIDHLLVDEAQDTSPIQWQILENLSAEFFAGEGRNRRPPTIFAVGDEKQSIFSFQGAAPEKFDAMRRSFGKRAYNSGQAFEDVRLRTSFRSVPQILNAVDTVFEAPDHRRGLAANPAEPAPKHESLKHDVPGIVELWPLLVADKAAEPAEWMLPVDALDANDPPVRLARAIAARIAAMLRPGSADAVHGAVPRPVSAGDIMILVRNRSTFFNAMIRALKDTSVPVAGADRLDVVGHIAVMDLMAAGHAALLPQDDLNLANVLKSPLIGLNDDHLMAIAPGRPGNLIDALEASSDPALMRAADRIAAWRKLSRTLNPFDFFSEILGPQRGRHALLGRLGPEAGDAIDAFLALALDYERRNPPSLTGFLASTASVDRTIKRDMEAISDSVRVMTVHAAKGLEAKIVFLPDTCGLPGSHRQTPVFAIPCAGDPDGVLAWSPRKGEDAPVVALARAEQILRAEEEHRRLLYVALTRAEERLYVAGFASKPIAPDGSWYQMAQAALTPVMTSFEDAYAPSGAVLRAGTGSESALQESAARPVPPALPGWLMRDAAQERAPAPPVRPSSALASADEADNGGRGLSGNSDQRLAGILVHALIAGLIRVPEPDRALVAQRMAQRLAPDMDSATRMNLAAEARRTLAHPDLAALITQTDSSHHIRSEVPVAARIERPGLAPLRIVGRIDCLIEQAKRITLIDYKTGAMPDRALSDTVIGQMALYRAAVEPLFPGRSIEALIVWTKGPRVEILAAADLDAAFARITAIV